MDIRALEPDHIKQYLDDLCAMLIDCVADGGAIGFLAPLSRQAAEGFWLNEVRASLLTQNRTVFAAFYENKIVGGVQLIACEPPNQPHRSEIAKMMVHPDHRRKGLARALMLAALDHAQTMGKSLVTLDTRSGDAAQSLYQSLGFEAAGVIPDFALDTDGKNLHATTYMFRRL